MSGILYHKVIFGVQIVNWYKVSMHVTWKVSKLLLHHYETENIKQWSPFSKCLTLLQTRKQNKASD